MTFCGRARTPVFAIETGLTVGLGRAGRPVPRRHGTRVATCVLRCVVRARRTVPATTCLVHLVGVADQSTPVRVSLFIPTEEHLMSAPTHDAATSTPTRQQARASARHRSRLSQARFAGYLAATAGCCGLATTADAEIISIDITSPNISGPNGGVPYSFYGDYNRTVQGWPVTQSSSYGMSFPFLQIRNDASVVGLGGSGNRGVGFATYGSGGPMKFGTGVSIGADIPTWTAGNIFRTAFFRGGSVSPDFGADSFMAFRFGGGSDWNYGYIEVTWDSANKTFEILSAAYESTLNTPIITPVPEPGSATMSFGALASLCLGGRALKRWKKQRRSEPQGDAGEPANDLPQTAA